MHDGSVLTCLEHMWQFDIHTGAPLGDAQEGLKRLPPQGRARRAVRRAGGLSRGGRAADAADRVAEAQDRRANGTPR